MTQSHSQPSPQSGVRPKVKPLAGSPVRRKATSQGKGKALAGAPRKSHAERRDEIARTALRLAAEQGAGSVSTQAIADAMGVSQATVFRHFATRDAVFGEAIALIGRSVMHELGPIFADKSTPGALRLERVVHAHLGFIQRQKGIPALLFSDTLHQGSVALKAEVRQLMKGYAGRVAGLVLDGVEDGSIAATADPALLAQTVVTMVQGIVLRWSLFDYAFDLETQADVILTLLRPLLATAGTRSHGKGPSHEC